MAKTPPTPDLARQNVRTPDRGRPSGHLPPDHANTHSTHSDEHEPIEKGRPKDTARGGA